MKTKKLNTALLANLPTVNTLLNDKYGKYGTQTRDELTVKARAWYYGELLKEKRKERKLTQAQLAERIGKKREYIALLEKGETDMQLSTLLRISDALGMRLELTAQ
ncbi:MAG: helix-turn-helix transcriptional regulator [Proteiniphilum sp.]|nr:helix-turn-helix transcriptional regulator [Proteiniphilum sp.]